VPIESTMEYLRAIPGARHLVLKGTGHIGSITQSKAFAEAIAAFPPHTARTDVA